MLWKRICKAGSTSPLYLMMQKRQEIEVTKLSQNNYSFLQCMHVQYCQLSHNLLLAAGPIHQNS